MVGGKIIAIGLGRACMHLWVMDRHLDELQIDVVPHQRVSIGDDIWWHGRRAYLSKADREFVDLPLDRIGYSHAPRPQDFEQDGLQAPAGDRW